MSVDAYLRLLSYGWQKLIWFVPVSLRRVASPETLILAQERNFIAANTAEKFSSQVIVTTAPAPKFIRPLLVWRWAVPGIVI